MKPAAFEYERPTTIQEAVAALDRHGDNAKVLAGGQSLIPMMNLRLVQVSHLVDIGRLESLRGIEVADGTLRIGALTTHNTLLGSPVIAQVCPLIAEAYHEVAHHSVRNRGTLGGSLCHNDPASEMPLIMSVLGATLVAQSSSGQRRISVEEFLQGDFTTALEANELLVAITLPLPPKSHGYAFLEVAQRKGDFALVACAALLEVRDGLCRSVRIGYRNIGHETVRLPVIEGMMEGQAPTATLIAEAAAAAADASDPPADIHATSDYRRHIVKVLTERVLTRSIERAKAL
mgnify:CR=1 FL=1